MPPKIPQTSSAFDNVLLLKPASDQPEKKPVLKRVGVAIRKYLTERKKFIKQEFVVGRDWWKPENLTTTSIQITKTLLLSLTIYMVTRTLLVVNVFESEGGRKVIQNLYQDGWFDLVLWIALIFLIVSSALRLFRPIRFSSKSNIIFLAAFALYYLEKYHFTYFSFYPSEFGFDYLALFIAPPLIEVFLRVVYVFFRRAKQHNSSFHENQPIQTDQEDKTTRKNITTLLANELNTSYFKNSFSIGLVGDWGVGKTSFINSLNGKVRDSIVIHFNPWLSTGKSSLLQEFIESLKEELSKYDKSISFSLDNYLNSLIELEKNTKTSVYEIIRSITGSHHEKSSSAEYLVVRNAIELIGKRIIVFVDDLDRLDKREIIDVLKLIRNTGDFTNTIYISCYDKVYLLHALQEFSKRNLNILLDKFFDLEVPLSPIPPEQITLLIKERFFDKHDINADYIAQIQEALKGNAFMQFRSTKKFLTSLSLNYQLYGNKLHLPDFFLLEVLKVKYPFIPSMLYHDHSRYFEDKGVPAVRTLVKREKIHTGETEQALLIDVHLTEYETSEFTKSFLTPGDRELICKILKALFPGELDFHSSRIQQPRYFDSYFYNSLPDTSIAIYDWLAVLNNRLYEQHPFFKGLFDTKKQDLIRDSFFGNKQLFQTSIAANQGSFFKFLCWMVDWSEGILDRQLFEEAFKLCKIQDKLEYFETVFTVAVETNHIPARIAFLASYISDELNHEDKSVTFLSVSHAQKINLSLCKTYFDLLGDFTNKSFEVLFNQIESLNPAGGKGIIINAEAFRILRNFLEYQDNRTPYLDLILVDPPPPRNDFEFGLQALTAPNVFKDVAELIDFIEESEQYPEIRKKRLIYYLTSLKKEPRRGYILKLEEQDLKEMPIEFRNAWYSVREPIKQRIQQTVEIQEITARSDEEFLPFQTEIQKVIDQPFEIRSGKIEFVTTPNDNTRFWQLGILLTEKRLLPDSSDSEFVFAEVFVSVGHKEQTTWINDSILELVSNKIDYNKRTLEPYRAYKGEPVKLSITIVNNPFREATVEVFVGDNSIGSQTHNLEAYRYLRPIIMLGEPWTKLNVTMTTAWDLVDGKNS